MHNKFLEQAIELSKKSLNEGAFPAGAVIVKEGKVIAESTSAKFPKIIYHAESNAIDSAMNSQNEQLTDCILYASMQPCLMCLSRAYWAGIRTIYYSIRKEITDQKICYESDLNVSEIVTHFNTDMKLIHLDDYESKALKFYNEWFSNQELHN